MESGREKWSWHGGEYKLSKSLVGVSEVTNVGSEAQ